MRCLLSAIVLLLASSAALASGPACVELEALRVAAGAGYRAGDDEIACTAAKVGRKGIVAFGRSELSGAELTVLLYERSSGQVVARHQNDEPGFVGRTLQRIRIERSTYSVRPGTRAIAIRTSSQLNSWDAMDHLSLYVEDQGGLRPILKDFIVYSFVGQFAQTDCSGADLETRVDLTPRTGHPSVVFHNLDAKTTRRETTGTRVNSACVISKRSPRVEIEKLRYRNGSYER